MSNTDFGRAVGEGTRSFTAGRSQAATQVLPFDFNGSGKEYFGIWIVNILLTLATLGIYSAWAKVRNKRYFNGNLELDGHRFDYHAEPMQILKGRLIVVGVLVVLNLLSNLSPFIGLAVLVFYAFALPWVIVTGLRFNANMTSYRGVRFHFKNTKWNAFVAYIFLPAVPLLIGAVIFGIGFLGIYSGSTLAGMWGLLFPVAILAAALAVVALTPIISRAGARFLGNGHSYGRSAFAADPPLYPYVKGMLIAFAVFVVFAGIAGLAFALGGGVGDTSLVATGPAQVAAIGIYASFFIGYFIYSAYARNNNFNNLKLAGNHRFSSTVGAGRYTWILISNAFLSLITIGLYIPWAKVRMARYLADNTFMMPASDLDHFTAGETDHSGVTSGEFLDIEGLDFGF